MELAGLNNLFHSNANKDANFTRAGGGGVQLPYGSEHVGSPAADAVVSLSQRGVNQAGLTTRIDAQQELSYALEVTTREGDRVTISFAHQSAYNNSSQASASATHGVFGYVASSNERASTRLDVSVSGDLSEAEEEAITSLVDRIQTTIDEFVQGEDVDLGALLARFDERPAVLSEFALSLSMQSQIQVSQAYTTVGSDAPQSELRTGVPEVLLEQLAQLGRLQKELIESARQQLDDISAAGLVRTAIPAFLSHGHSI